MTEQELYFDNNATTQPLPEVRAAMLEVLGANFGNPSSAHFTGHRGREHLRATREGLASLLEVDPSQLIFTSGGTEANNMVFLSFAATRTNKPRFVTTAVEHSSILQVCDYLSERGADVVYLPVNQHGHISISDLEAAITEDTALVSIQWVNNETGIIQPIKVIAEICHSHGVPFHTDAAQAVCKLDIDLSTLPVDFLSFTAHKFHGPQGVGALYAADRRMLNPIFYGGPQEDSIRPGTENVPGIVGMGAAVAVMSQRLESVRQQVNEIRDHFETLLTDTIHGVTINGDIENRIFNTTNLRFEDVDGQALVARLDQVGIRCSQSSACTNQRPEPSYVLRAMGLSEAEAYSSVRFGFSELNTLEEAELAVTQTAALCEKLRAFSSKRRDESRQPLEVN